MARDISSTRRTGTCSSRSRRGVRPPSRTATTDAEVRAAYAAYTSYAGTYVVRGAQVVHRVELSLFPNWIGGEQARTYEFIGDRLVLTAAPTRIRGREARASLVWERVASA